MLPDFPSWYQEVNAEPSNELIAARLKGVTELADSARLEQLPKLTMLSYGLTAKCGEYVKEFGSHFQKLDSSFRLNQNDVELSVLSSSVLACIFEKSIPDISTVAALCVSGVSFMGARENVAAPWLAPLAKSHLVKRSTALRSPMPSANELEEPDVSTDDIDSHIEQSTEWKQGLELLGDYTKEIIDSLNAVVSEYNNSLKAVISAQHLLQEETNFLWWLIGKRSKDINARFVDCEAQQLALVAGKELAEMTILSPGPLSIPALLESCLSDAKGKSNTPVSLKSVVTSADKSWRNSSLQGLSADTLSPVIPIHTALAKAEESTKWTEACQHIISLPATTKMSLLNFGLLFYHECLLLRSLRKASKKEASGD